MPEDAEQARHAETGWPPNHLGHNVHGTHQELVQVPVLHQVRAVDHRMLETRPDLSPVLC